MRSLLIFCLLACASASVMATFSDPPGTGQTPPYNPLCELKGLTLSGLTFSPPFSPTCFQYYCNCDATFTSTVVNAMTQDPGSNATLLFNGKYIGTHMSDYISPALTFVVGVNTIEIDVTCTTAPCNYKYIVTCTKPGPGITGDPQFVGLRGQNYQVHGVSGEIYNIVSDSAVQYNSRFVFLDSGACPIINGKKAKGCFSHPGSYLGELGLKTKSGDRIRVVSGPAADGFAEVTVNGKALAVGESVELAGNQGFIALNGTHQVSTQIGQWYFEFENSDKYVNQRVRVNDVKTLRSHGLLGQTWRATTYNNPIKHVQGTVDDYALRSGDIFGDDFVYNTHN